MDHYPTSPSASKQLLLRKPNARG
uniref:Uncharacterized protein n=1 Tax=Arundo donax TaxID=35708 RepID=A0A0A8ZWZ2_ARUDO